MVEDENNPTNAVGLLETLAAFLTKTGDLHGAASVYRDAIELVPTDAILHCNLGSLLSIIGDRDSALHSYQRAMELDPKDGKPFVRTSMQYARSC